MVMHGSSDMQTLRSRCKDRLVKIVAHILSYSPVLRVANMFVNTFRLQKGVTGGVAFPFVRRRRSTSVQILAYHRVNDGHDPFLPGTSLEVFTQQMDYLSSHYNVLSLEDAVERMRRNDVPDNAVVVTFDDGYRDNYSHAFPLLRRLSIPATIFLPTSAIGSQRVLWHDRVFAAFRETKVQVLEGFGTPPKTYRLSHVQEKQLARKEVLNFLRSLNDTQVVQWVDVLVDKLQVVDRKEAPRLMLSWDEAKIMCERGISFGSHTVTHPILSTLSADEARAEIYDSRRIIESHLGTPVKTFAYPSGRKEDFTEMTKRFVQEAGYICAVSMIFGANDHNQDLFELRRVAPPKADVLSFGMRLDYYRFAH